MTKIVRASVALAVLVACSNANAAVCSGPSPFGDVAASDSFCSNTEWLRNRAVTLGCGDGSNFCPFDNVTRAQMALFMNRLADAILPAPLTAEQTFGPINLAIFSTPICSISVPDADHPRALSITGTVGLTSDSGPQNIRAIAQVANDGAFLPNFADQFGTVEPGKTTNIPVVTSVTLGPGPKTVRLALTASVASFPVSGRCSLRVNAQSVTGATSPY